MYQYELSGEGGGTWYLVVADGTLEVHSGLHASPSTTLSAEASDYLKILNGELGGVQAFMTRKLRVKGNVGLARRLEGMFAGGAPKSS